MFDWFLSIFLDERCPLCRRAAGGDFVCQGCDRQLQRCQFSNPKYYWQGNFPLFVLGHYDGTLKGAIAAMKYNNQPALGTWLGEKLAYTWQTSFSAPPKVTVIPVPMHSEKQQQRGFNQAGLIAKRFAEINKLRCDHVSLQRTKATKPLFELNVAQRQQEMEGAFSFDAKTFRQRPQKPVLLVDDIYTSGTTAREARRVLQENGVSVLGIVAIATPKLPPTPKSPKDK
ncbi:hypothetical protein NIES208_06910 [[Limnothrix rosea] IAM M-220]|nr:hypothetical protein NIES208_06910 [[Limnothrix rosea] IAM M-220]